jgi:hypothetical protein
MSASASTPVYGWSTDGAGEAVLKKATSLLEQLNA